MTRRRKSAEVEPICGCDHHLALHDPETGRCHEQIYRRGAYARDHHWEECPCRQYVGPKPADQFFTSDVAWDTVVMKADKQ
jgi:hypothetical protein